MKDAHDLLRKAKNYTITKEEFDYVVQRIKASTLDNEDPNLYTLIHILGAASIGPPDGSDTEVPMDEILKCRKLVESFLHYSKDPMVSKIALQVLCSYWGDTKDYIQEIKDFAKGVDWDFDEDVRMLAISEMGEQVRGTRDKQLLKILIQIFENPQENEIIQECVYTALARAGGQEWHDLLRDENKPNPSIMKKIYQMLTNEG